MTSNLYVHRPLRLGDAGPGYDPKLGCEMKIDDRKEWRRVDGELSWITDVTYRYHRTDHRPVSESSLPEDDTLRNEYPMFDGLLAYFPNALAEAARVSKIGNDQHNPGEAMHWARGKSTDHGNKIMRHLVDVGKKDARGVRHSARLVWRALALLQEELEREEGYPMSRASKAA